MAPPARDANSGSSLRPETGRWVVVVQCRAALAESASMPIPLTE
jgi:hypothetical protein